MNCRYAAASLCVALASAAFAQPPVAESNRSTPETETPQTVLPPPETRAKSEVSDPKPTINWTGQLQTDAPWFAQDEASRRQYGTIPDGAAFRRARIGLFGDYGPVDYRMEMDFALAGRPSILDVFAGVKHVPVVGNLRVGHFFEPYSLERVTANRFTHLLERSLMDQAFVPARNLGVMAFDAAADERMTWAVGLFRSDSDVFGDDTGTRFESAVTGRVTALPVYEADGCRLIHLGGAYSFRGPNNGVVRFRAQPEARIGAAVPNVPFLVDTGNLPASSYQLLGAELAAVDGPFSVQAEFTLAPVHTTRSGTLWFTGWYVEGSYFLTGEHRQYRKSRGRFERVHPLRDAIGPDGAWTGPGAWQVVVRLSRLDLTDGPVAGGTLTDLTLGCNWHLNRYLRMSSNYILAAGEHRGRDGTLTHGFGLRLTFEF